MSLLEIAQLVFRANGRAILDGVDLDMAAGEIHALLGANGAGKTTVARIVMGCSGYAPTAGSVRLEGRDLAGLPMHERARLGITMAWQEPARFEGLPVNEYLSLGCRSPDPAGCLRLAGLAPEAYLERALDKKLSGGERKRIELASVVALRPRLAILDEPAAGIDVPSMEEIEQLILVLKREGSAVLLITHVEPVAKIADRASCLCGGRITFTGDPATAAERYRSRRCVTCDGVACAA